MLPGIKGLFPHQTEGGMDSSQAFKTDQGLTKIWEITFLPTQGDFS